MILNALAFVKSEASAAATSRMSINYGSQTRMLRLPARQRLQVCRHVYSMGDYDDNGPAAPHARDDIIALRFSPRRRRFADFMPWLTCASKAATPCGAFSAAADDSYGRLPAEYATRLKPTFD